MERDSLPMLGRVSFLYIFRLQIVFHFQIVVYSFSRMSISTLVCCGINNKILVCKGRYSVYSLVSTEMFPHNLPSIAGLYTRKPFQSPEGNSRAAGCI